MEHKDYAMCGADNAMVLLGRDMFIAQEIAVQQIDDFLLIPSCPNMVSTIERHDLAFRFAH